MSALDTIASRRGIPCRVNFSQLGLRVVGLRRWMTGLALPAARFGSVRDLDDHLARDIGLDPHDPVCRPHAWPSRGPGHPRL